MATAVPKMSSCLRVCAAPRRLRSGGESGHHRLYWPSHRRAGRFMGLPLGALPIFLMH